jgi:hypothetical protein
MNAMSPEGHLKLPVFNPANKRRGKCCGMLRQKTWRFIGTAVMTQNPALTTNGHHYFAEI